MPYMLHRSVVRSSQARGSTRTAERHRGG